jgi:hypothetical protein
MLPLIRVRAGRSSWRSASNCTTPLTLPAPVPATSGPLTTLSPIESAIKTSWLMAPLLRLIA